MNKQAAAYNLGLQSGFNSMIMPPDSVFEKVAKRVRIPVAYVKKAYVEKKAIAPFVAGLAGAAALPLAGAAWDAGKKMIGKANTPTWQQHAMSNYDRNAKLTQQAQMLRDSYNPQVTSPFAQQGQQQH